LRGKREPGRLRRFCTTAPHGDGLRPRPRSPAGRARPALRSQQPRMDDATGDFAACAAASPTKPTALGERFERCAPRPVSFCTSRAISSAGEHFVHTEGVTGSIPVSPTKAIGGLVAWKARAGSPSSFLYDRAARRRAPPPPALPGGPARWGAGSLPGAVARVCLEESAYRLYAHTRLTGLPVRASGAPECRHGFRRRAGAGPVTPVHSPGPLVRSARSTLTGPNALGS
jgi:hypothetical protein